MQTRVWRKTKTKIKGTYWSQTENGRYVDLILENAERNSGKDAGKNITATMG